jgi:hypothetical protein
MIVDLYPFQMIQIATSGRPIAVREIGHSPHPGFSGKEDISLSHGDSGRHHCSDYAVWQSYSEKGESDRCYFATGGIYLDDGESECERKCTHR